MLALGLWPALTARRAVAADIPTYTLAECMELTARQSPDVLTAAKRVEAARATIIVAKGALYPALTTNGYYQYRDQDIATQGDVQPAFRQQDYVGDVRVSQNLYSGGAVRKRIDASQAANAHRFARTPNGARHRDPRSSARLFTTTLYAEANIGIRQQAVDLLGAQLKDQKDRLAAGSASGRSTSTGHR